MGWKSLPHGEIEKHTDDLWSVVGSLSKMPLPRRMVVVRLPDGRLLIHSAVALDDTAMAQLEAWGSPAILVVPNRFHREDAAAFKRRYPSLRVLCPAVATAQVSSVVAVDGPIDELSSEPGLQLFALPASKFGEVVLVVRHADGSASAIVTDAVFNLPHQPGFGGLILKWMGSSGGPRVTALGKLLMVADRAGFAAGLRELAAVEGLSRILPAHGDVMEPEPAATLRAVADRLHA